MRDLQNRVLIVIGSLTAALLLLGFQLYRLTVAEAATWVSRASAQTQKEIPSHGPRGAIYDRSGRLLANSEPVFAAMLMEQDPAHVEKILPKLSLLLAEDDPIKAEQIANRVRQQVQEHVVQWRQFEDLIIATHLPQSVVVKFMERKGEFPGVTVVTQSARNYPNGPIASQVLGYVGPISEDELKSPAFAGYVSDAIVGKDGLELSYEKVLQGKTGIRAKLIDPMGRPVGIAQETPPEPGNSLVLTIDLELQKVAEKALADQIAWIKAQNDKEANPIRAALVAIEVKTGAVLAMAQVPTFDPNLFAKGISQKEYDELLSNPGKPLNNWPITSFAPGSTFKPAVGLAAVELGAIGYFDTVHCATVWERDPNRKNWTGYDQGHLYLARALAQSCNPYFYEMGYRLGIEKLSTYLDALGFGKPTGIDLPGEDSGVNPTRESYGERWQPGNVYSVAIGQGDVKVTPLQLAAYTATIANKGKRFKPYLVSEIRSPNGELVEKREPVLLGEIQAKPESWKQVQQGMWLGANAPEGTAYLPFVGFPIQVGAKTGSAETGLGYANGLTIAYAPFDDPQIAVAVIVEGGAHGSWVTPAARAVFAHYFGIVDKKPSGANHKAD